MQPVDLHSLNDENLFRLHLLAKDLLQEEPHRKLANWIEIVNLTLAEISRRGFTPADLERLDGLDREWRAEVLEVFRAEREEGRKTVRNSSRR